MRKTQSPQIRYYIEDVTIAKCKKGHRFPRFPDHPLKENGWPMCPHCMFKEIHGHLKKSQ